MYREIVETVSYAQGKRYLDRINELNKGKNLNLYSYAINDLIGDPITYKYSNSLRISPTTLRYVSVSQELKDIFGTCLGGSFVEIGAGYGGQAAILMKDFNVTSYSIFDLPDAQLITRSYLTELQTPKIVKMCTLSEDINENYDFVISNYAFSELPREIQDQYINQVLKKTKRGYLIMNSGISDFTGRQNGKHTLSELREKLPPFDIYEELPCTGPDNYVIVWGHEKERNLVD
jgi:putative sugar O-methyltransferase